MAFFTSTSNGQGSMETWMGNAIPNANVNDAPPSPTSSVEAVIDTQKDAKLCEADPTSACDEPATWIMGMTSGCEEHIKGLRDRKTVDYKKLVEDRLAIYTSAIESIKERLDKWAKEKSEKSLQDTHRGRLHLTFAQRARDELPDWIGVLAVGSTRSPDDVAAFSDQWSEMMAEVPKPLADE